MLAIYATGAREEETSDEVAASISIDCYVLVQKGGLHKCHVPFVLRPLKSFASPLPWELAHCFQFHLPSKMTHNIT